MNNAICEIYTLKIQSRSILSQIHFPMPQGT